MVFQDKELEEWVLTALGSEMYHDISAQIIIDDAPPSLIHKIPNESALVELLFNMEYRGLLTHIFTTFRITNDGKLHYRKFLEPLQIIANNDSNYKILDKLEGNSETKNEFKKLLKSIKGKTSDEADSKFRDTLYSLGKDAVWFTVRLIIDYGLKS